MKHQVEERELSDCWLANNNNNKTNKKHFFQFTEEKHPI